MCNFKTYASGLHRLGPYRRGAGKRAGLSLLELLAVVVLVSVIAAVALPRFLNRSSAAKKNACYTLKRNIEVQAQLWYRTKGSWPAANLSDIGANAAYFPEGLPVCPVDGSAYTFDSSSRQVVGHVH